jgi:hypothetical protein
MSDLPAPPPPPPAPPPERFHVGRLVLGLVIVAIGVGALLRALDVASGGWKVILPGALIAIGVGLLAAGLRSARGQGGLIAVGLVLTAILTIARVVDVPLEGGVGDRVERPMTFDRVHAEYHLAIGQLTIDLSRLSGYGPVPKRLVARVGIGKLLVVVPSGTLVDVRGHAGVGDVTIFGRSDSGIDVDIASESLAPSDSSIIFSFDLSVGIGQVEVRHG